MPYVKQRLHPVTPLHRVGRRHALHGVGPLLPNPREPISFTGAHQCARCCAKLGDQTPPTPTQLS